MALSVLALLFFVIAAFPGRAQEGAPLPASEAFATGPAIKALIVHDQADDPQLARELAAVLGHFAPIETTIVEETYYERRQLESFDVVFYLGGTHWSINPAFLRDIHATKRTVVWMGRGLNWLAKIRPLGEKYGFEPVFVDASGVLDRVTYKDTGLEKTNPLTTLIRISDPAINVYAWVGGGDQKLPYALRSSDFWYFADIPMVGATEGSAYLVLADLLHDVLRRDHPERHTALVRIEDIHPNSSIEKLNDVVDYLYYNDIRFGLALVPVYVNPATGGEVRLSERPDLVRTLKEAQAKGGIIVLHGYTHQRHGETVVDYEFWERETHAPPPDETAEKIRARVDAALDEANKNGIYPQIWETPHYAGSDLTHRVVAEKFRVVWERRDAPFFPYPVRLQATGQTVLPETLGYVNPREGSPAENLVASAKQQLVVRDGYAAFFFHPQVGTDELRKVESGIEEAGYLFTSPALVASVAYRPATPPSWTDSLLWHISDRIATVVPDGMLNPSVLMFIALFIIFYYWGIFLLSRKPAPVSSYPDPDLFFVIVIPALNEELVIARTLEHLLSLPNRNLQILVVDDNSDDRTLEIASSYEGERVKVISHPPALSRQGKGRVLNYAYSYLLASKTVQQKGPDMVIMCVLDADGRVEPNIIDAVNPYFVNPKAGAVQVGVRISNAHTNVLTRWQNFEFLAFARISQKAREHLGSVGLGGNGQFVRISALASLGGNPWTDCLTEDLDLGIRILLAGWRNHYCPKTFVSQQGVPKMRPLIRQRTRWFQGHLTCWRHIPALMIEKAPVLARTDTIYYLLAPILVFLFLPSSLMFLIFSFYFIFSGASTVILSPLEYIPAILIWYLFSFGALPTVVWTFWREEKEMTAFRAFLWAHIFAFFYVIWFIAGCRAIYRVATGKGSWAKTARIEESPGQG